MRSERPKSSVHRRILTSIAVLSSIALICLISVSLVQTEDSSDTSSALMRVANAEHQSRLESEKLDTETSIVSEQQFDQVSNLPDEDTFDMFPVSTHEEVTAEIEIEPNDTLSSQGSDNTQSQTSNQQDIQASQQQTSQEQPRQQIEQSSTQQSIASASAPLTIPHATSQLVSQRSRTIRVAGEDIPYAYSRASATAAPESGCAIWKGMELTDDGKLCYFVGHNPGPFHAVMDLQPGDKVQVCDLNKKIHCYVVRYALIVPQKSSYADIASRIEGHGESVVLQTCCGDNVNVRIVVAW